MPLPDWLEPEDALCVAMVARLEALAAEERARARALSDSVRELLADRNAMGIDALQRAALDEAIAEQERAREAHDKARRVRDIDPKSPYFGHLQLEEEGQRRDVCIGKATAVDSRLPAHVVDWRHAPISRLYYEYEEGDDFCEEIAGREREGLVLGRRTVDIRGGVLQGAETPEVVVRRRAGDRWEVKRTGDEVLERSDRRDDPEDHALPDIVALITRDQFAVLTRPESGVVVLRGQAGSGKTTVALHRIAYLRYQDPERFRLDRVLVVMFNKALQTYIRKALTDLDIAGVRVATFHGWAGQTLRAAGLSTSYRADAPEAVTRLKQHAAIDALLAARVELLGKRLEAWLPVPAAHAERWAGTPGSGLARVRAFLHGAEELAGLSDRVRRRLVDHTRDLYALFDDLELAQAHLPTELHGAVPMAAEHQRRRAGEGALDFADAALLLRLGQLVDRAGGTRRCPWRHALAHVVVDEAQDLSAPEIRVLLDAADERRSVTLAGDPAQTLYGGAFGLLTEEGGGALGEALEVDALPVGHRSTRPIMALALGASGRDDPGLLAKTRPGHPVSWLRGARATAGEVAAQIRAFRLRRPQTLVAVLCRTRKDADAWFASLGAEGLELLRRGHRDSFGFGPGTVVSNVHQVKGLEFDGVVLVEPGAYSARERNLLHVAITRAADELWVVSRGAAGLLEGYAEP